jgi:hypothetical protein
MVLDFSKATMQQLFAIVIEDCPVQYKYRAAFELQGRKEKQASRKVMNYKKKSGYLDKKYKIHI